MAKVRIASRTSTDPLAVPRTVRNHNLTILTSMPAGRMTPIAAIPLLREDSARVRLRMALQMMETADMLINQVGVTVSAYLVPNLAFERFTSMDDLNRSWEGKPARDGLPVTPFIERDVFGAPGSRPIFRYLGKHGKDDDQVNMAYIEAYNQIWNFRAKNRSHHIKLRHRLHSGLAPAFWQHERFAHIVPDWDQATMDGNVALNIVDAKMPVKGFGIRNEKHGQPVAYGVRYSDGFSAAQEGLIATDADAPGVGTGQFVMRTRRDAANNIFPEIWAEMQASGVTVSLANLELARKTQGFAKLRERYSGHNDDYIIDMLMDGLSIPEQDWRQPMLLQQLHTRFGMAQRYGTDGAGLTKSVVNGATMIDLNFGAPKCPCGGVIMIVAEALPEQLFERGRDPYMYAAKVEDFPHALRDLLDPEPVEAVANGYIDTDHSNPNGVFGFAPKNHMWNYAHPCIGGRFHRPRAAAGYNQDRERLWAVERTDPVLSEHFYISTEIHTKPFVNPNQDPFEVNAAGEGLITGLTQFGPVLVEASDNYDEVMAEAPQARIDKAKKTV